MPFTEDHRTSIRVALYVLVPGKCSGRIESYALFSFIAFLRELRVLTHNPIDDIKRPKKGKSRVRWETIVNDVRIVDASPADVQSHSAFCKATGAEVSAALVMKKPDIELWLADRDEYCGVAHVPDTKTETRDRHDVRIEKWARPYLEKQLRSVMPNALVWPGLARDRADRQHKAACGALGVDGYTLRDAPLLGSPTS
jgi:hypothetical protein